MLAFSLAPQTSIYSYARELHYNAASLSTLGLNKSVE